MKSFPGVSFSSNRAIFGTPNGQKTVYLAQAGFVESNVFLWTGFRITMKILQQGHWTAHGNVPYEWEVRFYIGSRATPSVTYKLLQPDHATRFE